MDYSEIAKYTLYGVLVLAVLGGVMFCFWGSYKISRWIVERLLFFVGVFILIELVLLFNNFIDAKYEQYQSYVDPLWGNGVKFVSKVWNDTKNDFSLREL